MSRFFSFKNIVIILVILRLVVFASFYLNYAPEKLLAVPDTDHYWGLANSLYQHLSFNNNAYFTSPQALTFGQPQAFRTPGYPLFLAVFWFFGHDGYQAVPIVQFLLTFISIYLFYLIAKKLFSRKVAQWSAVILLVEPTFLTVNYFILADSLFILFFLLFIYQAILFFQQGKNKHLVLTSLWLAIAMLVRPVLMYVPLIFIAVLLYHYRHSFLLFLKQSIIFLLLVVAFLSPWLIRNYLTFNQVFLTTLPSYNNWRYYIGFWSNGGDTTTIGDYWQKAQEKFKQDTGKQITEFVDFADPSNTAYYNQQTSQFIKTHLGQVIKVQLYRTALQLIDGRYFNYILEMFTGKPYNKGYSQLFSSHDKWQFIKSAPELLISSLLVFLIFLNTLAFYFLLLFKRVRSSLKKETMPALIFLGLLLLYFYATGAPGNIERYLLPAMIIEYLFLGYTLTQISNI